MTDPVLAGRPVLIVSPGVPHPREGASTVLFWHYIRGIAESGGPVLHVLLTDATNRDERLLGEYRDSMSDLPNVEMIECRVNTMYRLNRWTRAPRLQGLPVSVIERVRQFRPDAVVCLDLLAAAYASQLASPAARVVWLGDLNFQSFWYNAWYDVKDRWQSATRLPLAVLECWQWRRFYAAALADARDIVVSSKSSEAALARVGLKSQYLPYPWPAKTETGAPVQTPKQPTFVFFGSLSGLGSRSAFDLLINDVYPELLKTWGQGGFTLFLAGTRQAPAWVAPAIANKSEVVFKGFVDDLVSFMRGCHAVVVPIEVPVGNRSRILTAMAHGALVVAHANTSVGNPDLVSGENCLLAASGAEFARHLQRAVEDPEGAQRIAARGRQTYLQLFEPESAVRRFITVIRDGLAARPAGARA